MARHTNNNITLSEEYDVNYRIPIENTTILVKQCTTVDFCQTCTKKGKLCKDIKKHKSKYLSIDIKTVKNSHGTIRVIPKNSCIKKSLSKSSSDYQTLLNEGILILKYMEIVELIPSDFPIII